MDRHREKPDTRVVSLRRTARHRGPDPPPQGVARPSCEDEPGRGPARPKL